MLCEVCSSLDFRAAYDGRSGAQWGVFPKHHSSITNILLAAERGCELCKELVRVGRFKNAYFASPQSSSFEQIEDGLDSRDVSEDRLLADDQVFYHTLCMDDTTTTRTGATRIQFFQNAKPKSGTHPFYLGSSIFTDANSTAAALNLVRGRPIEERSDSIRCFNLIREWIQECITEHRDSCPAHHVQKDTVLPTRVIDVGAEDGSQEPKLFLTGNKYGTWLCLSHCWGGQKHLVLSSDNIKKLLSCIKMDSLPLTFRDAITTTRKLGYRYLWIDSLCILQGEDELSREDWLDEATKMQDYYKYAALTIAASDADGDEKGFLGSTRDTGQLPVAIPITSRNLSGVDSELASSPVGYVYFRPLDTIERFDIAASQFPLFQRAWTLQEDILSPRTIHFSSRQLYWECQKHRRCEADHGVIETKGDLSSRMKHLFLQPSSNPVLSGAWYAIVQTYMQRRLTVSNDKFPAIAGVAKEIAKHTNFIYKAGIWKEDFHRGLAWLIDGDSMTTRCEPSIAPSWSWASMSTCGPQTTSTSNILFNQEPHSVKAELVRWSVVLKDDDMYGALNSGYIVMRSLFLPYAKFKLISSASEDEDEYLNLDATLELDRASYPRFYFDDVSKYPSIPDSKAKQPSPAFSKSISLLLIASWKVKPWNSDKKYTHDDPCKDHVSYLLVLVPDPNNASQFVRIGVLEAIWEDIQNIEGWEEKEVTIV